MEHRAPQPTDSVQWARIERRRKALIWGGAVLCAVVALVAFGWLLFGRANAPTGTAPYIPIPGTDATIGAVPAETSASAGATASPSGASTSSAGETPGQPGVSAACMIAYRRAGKLCIARPDGSGEVVVVSSAEGAFALSPDARTLAYVDATARVLVLLDVASGKRAEVGPASLDRPAWSPDSVWCAYTGAGSQSGVRRVSADGSGGTALFAGTSPSVSADGVAVAGVRTNADGSSAVVVYRAGKAAVLAVGAYVVDVAAGSDRVYYAVAADDLAEAEIRAMSFSGGGRVVLKSGPQAGARASFHDLCLSSDGARLAYAEVGDDGYSRLFALNAADGGALVPLSVRRDDYPLCWGCDGRLYFIEGNAWQGEATKLMGVRGDGTGRVVVVEGAGR